MIDQKMNVYSNEYITSKIQFMGASASIAKIGTGPGAPVCRRCRARILCSISPIGLTMQMLSIQQFRLVLRQKLCTIIRR